MAKIKTKSDSRHTKPKNINKRAFERVYWPYIPIVFTISLLLGLGASSGNLQAYIKHPGGRVLSYSTSMSISGLLSGTNAERTANGLKSLGLNNKLNAAAQAKADDMAAKDYWSHNTPSGDPPWVFVNAQNYSYQKLGENLATGFDDENSTINGWMASAPHRANLLDPSFKQVGFGFANNPNYTAAGGGPMTIVVAFYGNPQVLSVSTSAPSSTKPAPQATKPAAVQPDTSSSQPATKQPTKQESPKQPQPVTTDSNSITALETKPTRAQLTIGSSDITRATTSISLAIAVLLGGWFISRHTRAVRRFVLNGERYAIAHPLTDIGLMMIASLLFILSQTAGIIK